MPQSLPTDGKSIEGYDALLTKLLDLTFSGDPESLQQQVDSSLFVEVACQRLGFETGVNYFFDMDTESLRSFADAVGQGFKFPFKRVYLPAPQLNTAVQVGAADREIFPDFVVENRTEEERRAVEIARSQAMQSPTGTTAAICYSILSQEQERWRRSSSEIERKWILIPDGELALFSFEWSVLMALSEGSKRSVNRDEAENTINEPGFIENCWSSIYAKGPAPGRVHDRSSQGYTAAITWLNSVFAPENREREYDYLWHSRDPVRVNWFIRGAEDVEKFLQEASTTLNFHQLQNLARLIVRYSGVLGTKPVDTNTTHFFQRSRFSPVTETVLGSENLVAFLLTTPVDPALAAHGMGSHAFLLAIFADKKRCDFFHDKIKALFYILSFRDIIRYSNKQLANTFERVERTIAIAEAIGDAAFMHELIGPIMRMNDAAEAILQESKKLPKGIAEDVGTSISRERAMIDTQFHRAMQAVHALQLMTNSLSDPRKFFDLSSRVKHQLYRMKTYTLKDKLRDITLIEDYARRQLEVQLIDDALTLILYNLITNAIEAIHESAVRAGVITVSVEERDGKACLSVADNGPGLKNNAPSELKLFDKGYSTKVKQRGNLGLGLYLCKHLAAMQQAEISGDNQPNGGAVFRVCFPLHYGRLRVS
jgi:signal transduction histidine kinase